MRWRNWKNLFPGLAPGISEHTDPTHTQNLIKDLRLLTDIIPDAVLIFDKNDVITWSNDSARQLLGHTATADHGQTVTGLIPGPEFSDWLTEQDKASGKLGIPCPVNDNIQLQLSVTRFGPDLRLLILRDVADVQNLDRARRDFIANISHEMRTPLTVLLGYLELLQDQPEKLDSKTARSMFRQARQMHALLDDLLELSRLQDAEIRNTVSRIDIPAMLLQLREQTEEYGRGEHELLFQIQPDLDLNGAEVDLRSAFQNLLINAVNYTPPGGTILVTWQASDQGLVLSVKDSGGGIPKQDLTRITERFYRVGSDRARQTGGTGLGLAIVKHILNSHQARLEISSELGKGSEFRCIFPFERQA